MFRSIRLFVAFLRHIPTIARDIKRLDVRKFRFMLTLRSAQFPLFYFAVYAGAPELGVEYSIRFLKIAQLWLSLKDPREEEYLQQQNLKVMEYEFFQRW